MPLAVTVVLTTSNACNAKYCYCQPVCGGGSLELTRPLPQLLLEEIRVTHLVEATLLNSKGLEGR